MKKLVLLSAFAMAGFISKAQDSTALFQNFDVDDSTGLGGDHMPPGWAAPYHVVDGGQVWRHYTEYGKSNSPCVEFNGYQGGADNADDCWLIAPGLKLTGYSSAMLHFSAVYLYVGDSLHAKVSTNYSGTGNPEASGVTWVEPNHYGVMLADSNNVSNLADFQIDLTPYLTAHTYVGFQYISTTTSGSRWTLDSITTTGVLHSETGISNVDKKNAGLKVIGSATANLLKIGFNAPAGNYFMSVYDMAGRNVANLSLVASEGEHDYSITGLSLTKGMYVIKLSNQSAYGIVKAFVE